MTIHPNPHMASSGVRSIAKLVGACPTRRSGRFTAAYNLVRLPKLLAEAPT